MSHLIIVGFDYHSQKPISQSHLVQKMILAICRNETESLCHWLKNEYGFLKTEQNQESIKKMYDLLSGEIPSMQLDQDETLWLKEYWIADCLFTALSKCFPLLDPSKVEMFQDRWFDAIYHKKIKKNRWYLHPQYGTFGHEFIHCQNCKKPTIPFKVIVNLPELPLPKTPNYCPECYPTDKTFYYFDFYQKICTFQHVTKIHQL